MDAYGALGQHVAATVLRRLLAPIPGDLRGLRDRVVLLVGFAGALRRSELATIRFEHLEKTHRGLRLTLPQTKGDQMDAVTVPLPYGETELCPVQALELWQRAGGLAEGPVFRRIWLPPRPKPAAGGETPALPRLGADASAPQTEPRSSRRARWRPGFGRRDLGGHSPKRGALTTGMDRGIHPRPAQAARAAQELRCAGRIPRVRRPIRRAFAERRALRPARHTRLK